MSDLFALFLYENINKMQIHVKYKILHILRRNFEIKRGKRHLYYNVWFPKSFKMRQFGLCLCLKI